VSDSGAILSYAVSYDPDTIATLPAADSHIVAGYHTDIFWTILAMPSIYLYLNCSNYCRSGQAVPVHRRLETFQLTLILQKDM